MRVTSSPRSAVIAAVAALLPALLVAAGLVSSAAPALAAPVASAAPSAAGTSATPAAATAASAVPAPDILNVNFSSGAPVDYAQSLAETTYGTPAIASDPLLGQNVATFNGSDGYTFDSSAQWSKLATGFTIECVFRYNGTIPTTSQNVICGDTHSGGFSIINNDGQLALQVNIAGSYQFAETSSWITGQWYDAVGTWNGTDADLYIDGQLAATTAVSGSLTDPAVDDFTVGADAPESGAVNFTSTSSVEAYNIWDTALSASQIAAEYQQSPVPQVTAPAPDILNVNFASGSPVDYAQGLTDTVYGTPTIASDPTEGEDVASFNGSSGYTFSSASQWNKLADGFSIECDFEYNGTIPTDAQNVICGDTHSGGFSIINNDGELALQVNIGGTYRFAEAPFVTGQWYDAVGTWNGTDAELYIDGQLAATTAVSGSLTDPAVDDFTVGADAPESGAVNFTSTSSVAAYKIWDSALSPAQVAAEYSQPAATDAAPEASILNVNFSDDAPIDYAEGLAETTYGTPTIATDPTFDNEYVASFNGSSGYTFTNSSTQWSRLATGFSIGCEFKYNGTVPTTTQNVICGDTHSGGFSIINNYGELALQVNIGGSYQFAEAPFVTGQWYDAVGTWNGTDAELYIDGQLAATTAVSGSLTDPAVDDFTVGADAPESGAVNFTSTSSVAAYTIWDTVLSPSQVEAATVHNVTVNTSGDGTASASVTTASDGQTVTLSEQPATGYNFTGWTATPSSVTIGADGTFTMPGEDVTVTATFAPNTYTVDFDGNGATGGATAAQTLTYGTAADLTANGYTNPGFYFAGWATTPDGPPAYTDGQSVENLTTTDNGTVTLYAVWIANGNYLVSVSSGPNGSASVAGFSQTPGATVSLTATPDTGYHLSGWTVLSPADGSVTVSADGTFTMPDEAVSVRANFAPNTYTVLFDGNGAAGGTMASVTLTYNQPAALPVSTFAAENEVFAGWGTVAAGPVVYTDGETVSNLTAAEDGTVTLYAQWSQPQVAAGNWPTLAAGFVTGTFKLHAVQTGAAVSQPLLGLWNGSNPVTFSEVSGDSWLSVSPSGVVTGTAPASVPQNEGVITVSATDGTTTSQILVEVPVIAQNQAPQVQTASWNAWDDGSEVSDAVGKNLAVIAAQGIDVIGFNSGGAAMAQQVASALGWDFYYTGDLGIVSAYPMVTGDVVTSTAAAPAAAATVDVDGQDVRIWDTALDSADYGPYNACFNGVTDPSTLVSDEESTTRYAQAQAVASELSGDVHSSTPVILLGDLESPSAADWTAATASSHCGVGAVDWPVPDVFAKTGLTDSFRVANPNPVTDPGNTWSPLAAAVSVPAPDVLNVDLASGSAADTAQNLPVSTVGSPTIAQDASLNQDVATFNGSSDAYSYPLSANWPKLATAFTIECQFRWNGSSLPSGSGEYGVCGDKDNPNGGTDLEVYEGQLLADADISGTWTFQGVNIQPGVWYDAVEEFNGITLSLYLNGKLATSVPATGQVTLPTSGAQDFALGGMDVADGSVQSPAPVSIAAARVWDTALSASQIAAVSSPFTLPGTPANAAGKAIPQDRIDYVYYAGRDLHVDEAHALTVGWPSAADVQGNSWASDHAAAVTTFTVGAGRPAAPVILPTVSVRNSTIAYQVGNGPAANAAFLAAVGAIASPGAAVSVDLSQVDFSAEGWYTAQVTATAGGYTSNPVDVAVRVAPVPGLSLQNTTATVAVGAPASQADVLTQLEPDLDVPGSVHVDFSGVDWTTAGSYPITVTATDQWGFTASQTATLTVEAGYPVTVLPAPHGAASASETAGTAGDTVTLSATPDEGYQLTGWKVVRPTDGSVTITGNTFTLSAEAVTVAPLFAPVTYTVAFDGNGATGGTVTPVTLTYDKAQALPANAFTNPGYAFLGWATSATGPVVFSDGQVVRNLSPTQGATVTLYAVWTPVVLTVTVSPATPDGQNGWYQTDPTLTATVTDADTSATSATIEYRVDGGAWQAYAGPLTAPGGFSVYQFQATDSAGNASAILTEKLKVDAVPPALPGQDGTSQYWAAS